jgi:hypothetical protein
VARGGRQSGRAVGDKGRLIFLYSLVRVPLAFGKWPLTFPHVRTHAQVKTPTLTPGCSISPHPGEHRKVIRRAADRMDAVRLSCLGRRMASWRGRRGRGTQGAPFSRMIRL